MRRVPDHEHKWKYYCLSPMSKKVKNEENHNASDDDCLEFRNNESMHVMHNEEETGTEPEESDDNASVRERSMPKSLVRKYDIDEDSEDDASTSEGSMPKLLVRKDSKDAEHEDGQDDTSTSEGIMTKSLSKKESTDDKLYENELEWEILRDAEDTDDKMHYL